MPKIRQTELINKIKLIFKLSPLLILTDTVLALSHAVAKVSLTISGPISLCTLLW